VTPAIDMTGQRFGKLVVLRRAPTPSGEARWSCVCDCGGERVVQGGALRKGQTTSCGCVRPLRGSEKARARA
jgi:hypothetical protein